MKAIIVLCAVFATLAHGTAASEPRQRYPSKPICRITAGAGGAGDFAGRLIAAELTQRLRQQVVVDNRPGGVISGERLARAQPDGYTLMMVGVVWLAPLMCNHVPYDRLREFAATIREDMWGKGTIIRDAANRVE